MGQTQILVADDSATIQKVFELAFENEDIEVLLTSDGSEALEMVNRTHPAMVIADVNMPGLDGFELCRALKSDEKSASIPVYLMSSALDDFDEARSSEVGAAGRFEKPFRSEDMVSKVKAVISSIQGGKAPEAAAAPETADAGEDTFDDIDIPLDMLLDAADQDVSLEDVNVIDESLETENLEPEADPIIVIEDEEPAISESLAPMGDEEPE